MRYFTDTEYLTFLTEKIERLRKTLSRVESLALKLSSSGGLYRNYVDAESIEKQLYRTLAEYESVSARVDGLSINPQVKHSIFKQ